MARHSKFTVTSIVLAVRVLLCVALSLLRSQATAGQPAKERIDLLVDGGTPVTMAADRRIIAEAAIAIRGDTIIAIGPRSDIIARYAPAHRLAAHGQLILPGLINGHNHAAMTLFRGLGDDLPLQEWLSNYIFPAEARNVDKGFVTWGTRLAALEMIRSGTTTYVDMYYFEDAVAKATREAGMRGVLGEAIVDFPAPDHETPGEALAYTENFLERWRGDPLIRAAVAPHSTYLLSGTLREAFGLARRYHAPILIHLAETEREVDESRAKHGLSPVGYLDSLGLLGPDVVAAHWSWVDAADIALLAAHEVGCIHNPSSNMMLASGVAQVGEMLAAKMRVGLGTDGPAGSNNDLSLIEEMDLAAKLQKVTRRDPRALNAQQALELATIGGARALHLEKELGSLEPGKKADLIILALDSPNAVPVYDLYAQIVYALKGEDVNAVVIGGHIVMQDRRVLTVDQARVIATARSYAAKVKQSLERPASSGVHHEP
jgi:5-methylthioadenosine/S-adenosylhomocysteine deaminase